MTLSAYFYVNRGIDYDLPFREVIQTASSFCDEVVVGSDPRFQDGTLDAIKKLQGTLQNIVLVEDEFNFDQKNPHAGIKNLLRKKCTGDWLLELDADKIVPTETGNALKRRLSQIPESVYLISVGILQLFNGNHVKTEMPLSQTCISRNVSAILHGGNDRSGAGYISERGMMLDAGISLCTGTWQKPHPNDIWIYHYGWYCLPRRWEMKQTHHYYQGRRENRYGSLSEYTINLDNEPVDFWDLPWQRTMAHYVGATIAEMKHPSIKNWNGKHPDVMKEWIARQQERIWVKKTSWFQRLRQHVR